MFLFSFAKKRSIFPLLSSDSKTLLNFVVLLCNDTKDFYSVLVSLLDSSGTATHDQLSKKSHADI